MICTLAYVSCLLMFVFMSFCLLFQFTTFTKILILSNKFMFFFEFVCDLRLFDFAFRQSFPAFQIYRKESSRHRGQQNGFEKSQLLRRSASSDRANLSRASTSGISSLGASNSARSSPLAPCSYDPVRERPQPRDRPTGQQQQSGRHFYAHFSEEDRRRYDQ